MINLKQMSLSQLLDLWELTETNNDKNIYDVRGWLMDEIKSRNLPGLLPGLTTRNQKTNNCGNL